MARSGQPPHKKKPGHTKVSAQPKTLDDLIAAGDLVKTSPDPQAAEVELEMAQNHLRSAEILKDSDAVMAYTCLYDAVRKSISAHMRLNGVKTATNQAKHVKTMNYARAVLTDKSVAAHLTHLNHMKNIRNKGEYEAKMIGVAQVEADLEHARKIVEAILNDKS